MTVVDHVSRDGRVTRRQNVSLNVALLFTVNCWIGLTELKVNAEAEQGICAKKTVHLPYAIMTRHDNIYLSLKSV